MTTFTLQQFNDILEYCSINDVPFDYYEGVLLDNAIIYSYNHVNIEGKTAKYIVLKETYVNEWNSRIDVIFIDDDKMLDEYIQMFEVQL